MNETKTVECIYRLLAWHSGYLLSVAIHLDAFSCNLNFPGLAFSNYGLAFFCWGNSRKSTSPIFISQTTDFHCAYKRFSFRNCRFSFRKLQHFVSPFRFAKYTKPWSTQARRKRLEPPLIHSKQAPPEIAINQAAKHFLRSFNKWDYFVNNWIIFYKNVEAEIDPNFKNVLRTFLRLRVD